MSKKEIVIHERGVARHYAVEAQVLPPARNVPMPVDPYAASMAQVQQVVKYEATPITRAHAMVMKVNKVTVALAILTGAAMYMFKAEFYFFMWLALASVEWVAVFVVLAVIDYRETPSAQHRHQTDRVLDMMEREQRARLRATYGDNYDG